LLVLSVEHALSSLPARSNRGKHKFHVAGTKKREGSGFDLFPW
jgi:hypothetical protein